MNRILLLSFFYLVYVNSFAENFYIDLYQKRFKLENSDFHIEKVVNVASEKHCIGYIQRGLSAKMIPVFFRQGTEAELTDYLNRSLPNNGKTKAIYLQVNKIYVSEATYYNNEVAVASASLTFYEKVEGGYNELFTSCYTLTRRVLDATSIHNKNMNDCLATCFELFLKRKEANMLEHKFIPEKDMDKITFSAENFEITKGLPIHKGIFNTYNDFLYNTPDTLTQFRVKYSTNDLPQDQAVRMEYKNYLDEKEIWGFSDGKNIYIKHFNKAFYPLFFENGRYYMWSSPPPTQDQLLGSAVAAGFFGLIGGVIASSLVEGNNKEKVKYFLNYMTSELLAENTTIKYQATTLICVSLGNDEDRDITLWIDGKKQAELSKGTYYKIVTDSDIKTLNITLTVGEVSLPIVAEPTLFRTDILMCKVSKSGSIKNIWLMDQEKDAVYEQILRGDFKQIE